MRKLLSKVSAWTHDGGVSLRLMRVAMSCFYITLKKNNINNKNNLSFSHVHFFQFIRIGWCDEIWLFCRSSGWKQLWQMQMKRVTATFNHQQFHEINGCGLKVVDIGHSLYVYISSNNSITIKVHSIIHDYCSSCLSLRSISPSEISCNVLKPL